jgi:hypothetical protein
VAWLTAARIATLYSDASRIHSVGGRSVGACSTPGTASNLAEYEFEALGIEELRNLAAELIADVARVTGM